MGTHINGEADGWTLEVVCEFSEGRGRKVDGKGRRKDEKV
jgi:hypothetical protein